MNIGYIVLGIIVVVALWVVFAYNRFVTFVNRVKEAWADIDVQLKRRYDLIPNLVELQRELSDTENKIQAARRFYNGVVQELSVALESFPSNLIGKAFGFTARDYFELGEGEGAARNPVRVSF